MLLNRRQYLIKERVAFVKLTDTYEIFDPESGNPIGVAREEPSALAKYGRLLINKALLPTVVNVYEAEGSPPTLTLHKGVAFFRPKITVTDPRGTNYGYLQGKMFSLGGGFYVYDANNAPFAEVKGDWKGWNFKFLASDGGELGVVTKKWAGLGKELFTSADNYMVALSDRAATTPHAAALILAAGLAIDIVFKEKK